VMIGAKKIESSETEVRFSVSLNGLLKPPVVVVERKIDKKPRCR